VKFSALFVFCLLSICTFAKDSVAVKVVAVHQATHEARDFRAQLDSVMTPHDPKRYVEVFNLDTIINGEHVILACADDKGCEAPAIDAEYQGEMKGRNRAVHLTFSLPVTHKEVKRWYKIAGSW
jgi:hypothetical protein